MTSRPNIPASAGSRDSALTSHGVLQARRLGAHLISRVPTIGPIVQVFASDLQRAHITAQSIVDAQSQVKTDGVDNLVVTRLVELRERDFRSGEGKKYGSRSSGDPDDDAETHGEMRARVDRFIENHLDPALRNIQPSIFSKCSIVVVAHGLILNSLLGALQRKYPPGSAATPDSIGSSSTVISASWSNTGYLEAKIRSPNLSGQGGRFEMVVMVTNNLEHLQGVRKTRGGIGSSKFDAKQSSIKSFFGSPADKTKRGMDGNT